ncbi:MAG: metallophosphoesterase family protein [Candidatus Woesebacteria bacterium]|nr:metallophosphoesterase family protein [Candidatus Woesebacteria bacterium]
MKLLVIGDSHGNIANLKHVMGFAINIKAKAIIHTGDWNNLRSVETVLQSRIPLYAVRGNADIDPKFEFPEFLKFEVNGVKIGLIHNIKKLEKNNESFDVIFYGHTHKQGQIGNIINPGALENGINFAVFDTKTKMIEFIHE